MAKRRRPENENEDEAVQGLSDVSKSKRKRTDQAELFSCRRDDPMGSRFGIAAQVRYLN